MSADIQARGERTTIVSLFVGYAGYYICRSNLSVGLPLISEEFHLTETQAGAIASTGVLVYGLGKISNGVLADFFGGRAMFLLGMLISIACTVAFGMASGLVVFCVIWAVNRYFQSMGWVGLVKISSRWFPMRRHATVMGILSMSYLLGDAIARLFLGGVLKLGSSWRGMFMAAAAALAAIALFNIFTLKSSPKDIGGTEPPANPANVFGTGGEDRAPPGIRQLLRPLLTNPLFWLICAMNLGLTLVRETFNTWTPMFLVKVTGLDVGSAGVGSTLFPLVGAAAAFLAGWVSDAQKGRHGRVVFPSVVLLVLTMFSLSVIPLHGRPVLALVLLSLVSFFLIAPYSFLSGVMALELGGKSGSATAAGLVDAAGYLVGGVVSGIGVGAIVDAYGWSTAFGALAGVCVLTAIIALIYWIHHERTQRNRVSD